MTNAQKLAEIAFNAYRNNADQLTHDNRPIPEWDNVGDAVQSNWRASVRAVFERLGLSLADDVSRETSMEGETHG
jgi:hypothetical protein